MAFKFLNELKQKVGNEIFKAILDMADKDIKFNNVKFGKVTSQSEFITICQRCYTALLRA